MFLKVKVDAKARYDVLREFLSILLPCDSLCHATYFSSYPWVTSRFERKQAHCSGSSQPSETGRIDCLSSPPCPVSSDFGGNPKPSQPCMMRRIHHRCRGEFQRHCAAALLSYVFNRKRAAKCHTKCGSEIAATQSPTGARVSERTAPAPARACPRDNTVRRHTEVKSRPRVVDKQGRSSTHIQYMRSFEMRENACFVVRM
ncbi:hypothetical protein C8Q73DRAFT_280443 [Cubamyces lactineus]|nr:hypothetical protein C8Q73DRAFT_280443 [Cubamyces lactineus]